MSKLPILSGRELISKFPREERYLLCDQMRRSSRSIPSNIAEGWAKRKFENVFKKHLIDSIGSCEEMLVWCEFSKECDYIGVDVYERFVDKYREVGVMLDSLLKKWVTF